MTPTVAAVIAFEIVEHAAIPLLGLWLMRRASMKTRNMTVDALYEAAHDAITTMDPTDSRLKRMLLVYQQRIMQRQKEQRDAYRQHQAQQGTPPRSASAVPNAQARREIPQPAPVSTEDASTGYVAQGAD